MKGLLSGIVLSVFCLCASAQSRAIVDFQADDSHSIKVADSTALALVGNVMFHHNGAILTCDSAVRYGPDFIECFDNVIINRDSTYIYGDRADFNGVTNLARVYAPIIKTVDGDMTMYSYDMEFNTLTKIGKYTTGGTITQQDNEMESVIGIYHADERDIYFVREVVMRNEEYIIQTDSMGYNFDSEITTFYSPAKIWNKDGDFLSADLGNYDRMNDRYTFTKNSYILTADQEVFADSINYMPTAGLAYMFRNIQIHDHTQMAYLFGDFGVYWLEDNQGIMTENPSVIAYEEGENPDSVYMRGDSIFLHTVEGAIDFTPRVAARLRMPRRSELDSLSQGLLDSLILFREELPEVDSTAVGTWDHLYGEAADTMLRKYGIRGNFMLDSMQLALPDSLLDFRPYPFSSEGEAADSLSVADSLASSGRFPILDPDGNPYPLHTDPPGEGTDRPEGDNEETEIPAVPLTRKEKRKLKRQQRLEARTERIREYAIEQGLILPDSLPADTIQLDSLPQIDSLILVDTLPKDSLQQIIRAYYDVKIFRNDVQAICDSLVAYSIDSTAHMYIGPILWNEESQITADIMDFYSRDEELYRADFIGEPLMVQWVLDSLYNQVIGDKMEAYFKNNEIDRLEVYDNAENYYYPQEEGKPEEVGGFFTVKSKDMSIHFDSMKVRYIHWYERPEYALYPMDKIPDSQPQYFDRFEWHADLRPKSKFDVWDRLMRPSQREESESIPYPEFRITETMEANKRRYREQGIWRDRNEVLSVDPSYFRNQQY